MRGNGRTKVCGRCAWRGFDWKMGCQLMGMPAPLGRPDTLTLALSHEGCCAQPPSFRRKPALQRTESPSRGAGQREGTRDLTVNPSYLRLCIAPVGAVREPAPTTTQPTNPHHHHNTPSHNAHLPIHRSPPKTQQPSPLPLRGRGLG